MQKKLYTPLQYIRHFIQARHWRGHGVHSPFVFELLSEVVPSAHTMYHFAAIEQYRNTLLQHRKPFQFTDWGTGRNRRTSLAKIASRSASGAQKGELLSRLVHHFKPSTMLEVGSSVGIGTLYLALAHPKAQLFTLEGCPRCAEQTQSALEKFNCTNASVWPGPFDQTLPQALQEMPQIDLIWLDGNHQYGATMDYFNQLLPHLHNNSALLIDDLYWSKGMTRAWNEICRHPSVTVSIDLFDMGLVFFRKECQKQHFKARR